MIRTLAVCFIFILSVGFSAGVAFAPTEAGRIPDAGKENDHRYPIEGWGDLIHPRPSSAAVLEEFLIDTSTSLAGAAYGQGEPSIAFDGTNYLVVWHDWRGGNDWDIYGARVSPLGQVLDSVGVAISTAPGTELHPAVAFDGANYMVVWEEASPNSDLYGVRLDPSGALVDSTELCISASPGRQAGPELAFDGSEYFVVWSDYRRDGLSPEIYGARVDTSGVVLDTAGIPFLQEFRSGDLPSIAFGEENYLVVWSEAVYAESHIRGARVTPSGTVIDTLGLSISSGALAETRPSVAFDGVNWLVVWEDYNLDPFDADLRGVRVDTSGVVLDASDIEVSSATEAQQNPRVLFDGRRYLVTWADSRSGIEPSIYGARVDTSGAVIDTSGIAISDLPVRQSFPSTSFDGSNYLIAWEHGPIGRSRLAGYYADVWGTRIDSSGVALDTPDVMVSTAAYYQILPSSVFDGMNYFVVWQDGRTGPDADIYGTRVSQSGSILDADGIPLSVAGGHQLMPSLASSGSVHLAVWTDLRSGSSSDIYGTRLDALGTVLDPDGIPICTAAGDQQLAAVAYNDGLFLVVWLDSRSGSTKDIYGSRVDLSGAVLDTSGIRVCPTDFGQGYPSVAACGDLFLVTWENYRSGPSYWEICGTRIDSAGSVLDSSGIAISCRPENQRCPRTAFGEANCMVVWQDRRNGYYDIYGARVSSDGSVLDTSGICLYSATGHQELPSITYDGMNFVVAWREYLPDWNFDIYGTRVDTAGIVLDPAAVKLIDQPWNRMHPVLSAGMGGQVLLVYDGFAPEPYNTQRVFGAFYYDVGVQEEYPTFVADWPVFALKEGVPNPFQSRTTVRYHIPAATQISLRVYDSSGRLVNRLQDGTRPAGSYSATWDGKGTSGEQLPSGIYFCRLQAGDATATRKMVLLR